MAIKLNRTAFDKARALIRHGAIDRTAPWSFDAADGNAALGNPPDWAAYGAVHLGVDPAATEKTKARFHYPLAKHSGAQLHVYMSALRAIRARAAQQHQHDIFDAAGQLMAEAMKKKAAARTEIAACAFELKRGANGDIQLTPAGEFRARDGRPKNVPQWRVDGAVALKLLPRLAARRTAIVIDYEHQTLLAEQNGKPAPAAGWFAGKAVELRNDGLWAKDVQWTDRARAFIDADEYRYISPVFSYDPVTGDVTDILSAALTNNPGVDGMASVSEAARLRFSHADPSHQEDPTVDLSELIALLGLAEGATEADVASAIAALTAGNEQLAAMRGELKVNDGADPVAALRERLQGGAPDPAKFVPVETVRELQEQVAALSASERDREVDGLVKAALSDGRLLPAMESWARELGKKDVAALKSYIESAQPIAALKGTQTGGRAPAGDENGGSLTESQLAICKATGISPEDYKKQLTEGTK